MLKAMIVSLALVLAPLAARADEAPAPPAPAAGAPTAVVAPTAAPAPTPEDKSMHGHGMEGKMAEKVKRENAGKKAMKGKPSHKEHYTCPMDGGDYDAPGQCPKCHMELVRVEPKNKVKGKHPEPEAGQKK